MPTNINIDIGLIENLYNNNYIEYDAPPSINDSEISGGCTLVEGVVFMLYPLQVKPRKFISIYTVFKK